MSTAMVWGASGGIGKAIVEKLVDEGISVTAVSRSSGNYSRPVKELKISDIRNPEGIQDAIEDTQKELDKMDFWVYAVGDITSKPIMKLDPEEWNGIVETNLTGAFLAVKYSAPVLKDNTHMIFVGAVSERTQLPGLSAYVSAKAGLESFVEVLRKEERDLSISIVRPKAVDTTFWNKVPFNLPHGASKPGEIAGRIFEVFEKGETGKIDI